MQRWLTVNCLRLLREKSGVLDIAIHARHTVGSGLPPCAAITQAEGLCTQASQQGQPETRTDQQQAPSVHMTQNGRSGYGNLSSECSSEPYLTEALALPSASPFLRGVHSVIDSGYIHVQNRHRRACRRTGHNLRPCVRTTHSRIDLPAPCLPCPTPGLGSLRVRPNTVYRKASRSSCRQCFKTF